MPVTYLTRKTRFASAHRYWRPEWDAQQNQRVFGACANPHGHGHNYLLEVTVEGAIDEKTGYCVNLPELDDVIQREIRARFDHQYINHAIPEFGEGGLIPTSENIVAYCWDQLARGLPDSIKLYRLRLHEDETFFVDYFGGAAHP